MRKELKYLSVLCLGAITLIVALGSIGGSQDTNDIPCSNCAVTSCWACNLCGHKSHYYSYPNWSVQSKGTDYRYTKVYVEGGNSVTVTVSASYTSSFSTGLEFGRDLAKASLGFSGSETKGISISSTAVNTGTVRKYVHIGVEYANRRNTLTDRRRTYNPTWDPFGWNKYCTYNIYTCMPRGKIATGYGLTLLTNIRNDF